MSVHFVTLLVFILGAAVVRMKAVRRLCVTAVVQPHGSVSAAGMESHCSAIVAVAVTWWRDCKVPRSPSKVAVAGHQVVPCVSRLNTNRRVGKQPTNVLCS